MNKTEIFDRKTLYSVFIFALFAYILDFAYYHFIAGPALTIASVIVALIIGLLKGIFPFITAVAVNSGAFLPTNTPIFL